MRGPGSSVSVAAFATLLMAVAVLQQHVAPVAEAATSPVRRHHEKRARHQPIAADQPAADRVKPPEDDYGGADYDDEEYEDNGSYHRRPTPAITTAAADSRTMLL